MKKKRLTSLLVSIALLVVLIIFIARLDVGEQTASVDSLRLNEIMLSNKGSVPDGSGDYPDWVEIYNGGSEAADISGFGLSDSLLEGPKYVFPAGTVLESGEFIVVWCSGDSSEELHAPFKLNAEEEAVLFDPTSRVVDSADLMAVDTGLTLSRQSDGNWVPMKPSPGFENSEAGIAAYEAELMSTEDMGLYINEFMASNATTIPDSFGVYSDWVEIYNSTLQEIDLSGFGISDSIAQPMKYRLPEGTSIAPGGYLVIFFSGNEGLHNGELHAPFGLRAYEEDVVLSSAKGRIVDSFSYSRMEADVSMARTPDGTGEFAKSAQPTPGYPNTSSGYEAFNQAHRLPLSGVYISEFGNAYGSQTLDWVEIHNATSQAVTLTGYGLTNNPGNPAKWVFPETTIGAGQYMLLQTEGDDPQKKNPARLSFNISASGESLFLFDSNGQLLDKLSAGRMKSGLSYGRDGSDNRMYYIEPTPGSANGTGYKGITSTPVFDLNPGIYSEPVTLTLSAGDGEVIRYTTDSTTPNASSPVYTTPIQMSKNTVVRAAAFKDGCLVGDAATGTYLFTSDNVNHTLPVVTLVTDPDNLWDEENGIYAYGAEYDASLPYGEAIVTANYFEDGDEWERPASFELFDENGQRAFNQNVGISIAGAFGRGRAQKGFNVIARSEYGDSRLNYEFFPDDRDFGEYKAIVLRAGAQDQNRSKIRDELAVDILEGADVNFLYQAYEPCVLYLNGEYWGVYFMKEKRNRFFVAQHEDTLNTDDMLIGKASSRVSYGTNTEWTELMAWLEEHSLSSSENYKYLCDRVDVDSFMDYMVCELYTGNSDYANIQYYKLPGGKWKWIYYDFCWGFTNSDHKTVTLRRGDAPAASGLFNALLENPQWKDAFCRRFAELLNTQFTPEKVKAAVDKLYAAVDSEIERERLKFNGETFMGQTQHAECHGSYDSFIREVERIRKFAEDRPAKIKADLKEALGLSDSYMQEVFG